MKYLVLILLTSIITQAKTFKIVTSTQALAVLTKSITAEIAEVNSLTQGTEDPHHLNLKLSHIIKLNGADLLLSIGAGLEDNWLPAAIKKTQSPKLLNKEYHLVLSEYISLINNNPQNKNHNHSSGNPHFIIAPSQQIIVAEAIKNKLVQLLPESKKLFETNFKKWKKNQLIKIENWKHRIAKTKIRKVISYHNSFDYILNDFKLELVTTVEDLPGIEISSKKLKSLLDQADQKSFQCILQSEYSNAQFAEKLSKESHIPFYTLAIELSKNDINDLAEGFVKAIEACDKLQK